MTSRGAKNKIIRSLMLKRECSCKDVFSKLGFDYGRSGDLQCENFKGKRCMLHTRYHAHKPQPHVNV